MIQILGQYAHRQVVTAIKHFDSDWELEHDDHCIDCGYCLDAPQDILAGCMYGYTSVVTLQRTAGTRYARR